ncbi:MAG TPA: hypothetical protein VMJ65_21630 [Solirubrobacteraceae bacterium]|nr:hypothetical protein [Solirubrobacteraceae bacterium]
MDTNRSAVTTGGYVTELLYELLDAHLDTMRMARDLDDDPAWAAHLDYLRDLQRVGREALANGVSVSATASR